MCGITGIVNWQHLPKESLQTLKNMTGALEHRGPDGRSVYIDDQAALGHARLSIIDLKGGRQPLCNEDGTLWLTCNGEIFNYIELREELKAAGHQFSTNTDVEVLLHLFEEYQENIFEHINGQYAFAIWDRRNRRLFLGRDHVGICPLYFWSNQQQFAFASEVKALFQIPAIAPELNLFSLLQTFHFWSPLPGDTPFQDIFEVKPGCYMWVEEGRKSERRYWNSQFPINDNELVRDMPEAIEELTPLLENAVKLRLRADVPVGAYLSGGLDSSIITSLIKNKNENQLRTFSIGFEDENYDESQYQKMVSKHLNTDHSAFKCTDKNIAEILLEVIWHTEKPLLRTAPAPLYLLSKLVRDSGYKVVLTGEGADEFFCGYNIFKETKVRCFNAQQPESTLRPLLFERLYPYLDTKKDRKNRFWASFFKKGLLDTNDPFYSHRIRWQNSAFIVQFLSDDAINQIENYDPVQELSDRVNSDLENLSPISRAQFLEVYIFLGNYLLSSQGDRMLMSHAVEGRFPFLDRKVIEFANRLSPTLKLKGLKEKWILKKAFAGVLPPAVVNRDKQPYRAPIKNLFSSNKELVEDFVSTSRISRDGIFSPEKVNLLKRKIELHPNRVSPREEMAWTAIITTEMLNSLFLKRSFTQLQDHKEQWFVMDHRTNKFE